jgi:type VI secretion system protein ImpJ
MSDPEDQIRLALNLWHNGQILQPEHFLAEEQAILGEVCQTARLPGLPFYGVAQLAWDEALLARGTVSITALTVVFASGELMKLGSNATVADFVLGATGATATLYLHLSNKTTDATGMDLYRDDKKWVSRVVHQLVVSTDSSIQDARQPMKLATLVKQAGKWQRSPAYVPPLLRVGTSPFLGDLLARLDAALAGAQIDLREEISASTPGADANASRRRCQAAVYGLRALLADLDKQVHVHPYLVIEALRAFYLEACVLRDKEPDPAVLGPYDHDDLASGFNPLVAGIEALLDGRPTVSPERLEFKPVAGSSLLVAGPFPPTLIAAARVFLLVPRPAGTYQKASIVGLKLASPSRLDFVHRRALRGVRLEPSSDPPPSTFGADLDVYRVSLAVPHEEEWPHAASEGALAYHATPALRDLTLALAWSAP